MRLDDEGYIASLVVSTDVNKGQANKAQPARYFAENQNKLAELLVDAIVKLKKKQSSQL
jgi:hypothetical protein